MSHLELPEAESNPGPHSPKPDALPTEPATMNNLVLVLSHTHVNKTNYGITDNTSILPILNRKYL